MSNTPLLNEDHIRQRIADLRDQLDDAKDSTESLLAMARLNSFQVDDQPPSSV